MENNIINSFILQDNNSLHDIYEYIKSRYDNSILIDNVKIEIKKLIKHNMICIHDKMYKLTKKGHNVLNSNKYYHSRKIIEFYKKHSKIHKKYKLKEIRLEQQELRNYLIKNKEHKCIICN